MGDHMKVLIFQVQVTVCIVLQTTLPYQLQCPTKLFWNARAAYRQCKNGTMYHCLLDGKSKQYIETCLHPKPYRKGLRAEYNLNLDAKRCSKDRFSPHHIMSHAEHSCPYIKSNCNGEGQIMIDHGSAEADRNCRCDYTRGYNYINRPKDPCRCSLLEMDCSCYVKHCPYNSFLSPDYECQTINVNRKHTCKPIESQRLKEERSTKTNITSFNDQDWMLAVCRIIPICLVLLFLLAASIPCLVSDFDIEKHICCQTSENNEEITYIEPLGADEETSHIVTTAIHLQEETTNTSFNETKETGSLTQDETTRDESSEQQVECIFRQVTDMAPVPYYQETKQYDEAKMHFEKGSRLVILSGPPGAGKTQTALHYCNKMKEKYSIVAKLVATEETSLLSSLKGLLKELQVPLNMDENENVIIGSLLKSLSYYLNHSSRKACLYLIMIDDVPLLNQNLIEIIRLLEFVKNLKFLLTTYDSTLKYSYVTACMVDHNGMSENECLHFFKQSAYFANVGPRDIKEIANKTGTIPLALNCARQFLEITNKSIESYLLKFDEDEESNTLESVVSLKNPFYRYSILQSQRIPLEQIQENIGERLWKVFLLLPLLVYSSISNEVLEACCYHLSKDGTPFSIDGIICHCIRFSVCHTVKIPKHRLSVITNDDEQTNLSWSFHYITMLAVKWMDNQYDVEKKQKQIERLTFLLKVFSFEIDIDTKDDITLERNLLFISHAIKILDRFEQMNQEDKASDEVTIYLAYLNCAVGKTLLFEGTDIKLAHKYLMKSRDMCLIIVGEESLFKKDLCLYPNIVQETDFERPNFSKIEKGFNSFCNKKIDECLIKEFILSKRRSPGEIMLLHNESKNMKICNKSGYLRDNGYKDLVSNGLAIPHTVYKNFFLIELFLHIIFDNGRTFNELRFITESSEKKEYVRGICNFEFCTCNEFCRLLKASDITQGYKILLFLDNDRTVQSYIRWTDKTDISVDEIDNDIENITDLSNSDVRILHDFGIAKMSPKSNDHHVCMCCKLLLKNMLRKLKAEKDENTKKEIFEKGRTVVDSFLERIETNKDEGWLALPLFYIQCGNFLLLSTDEKTLEQALNLFEDAITAERNRQDKWTRFLWEGYFGKVRCLSKLFRRKEAKDIYDYLKNELQGTGRDTLLRELELII